MTTRRGFLTGALASALLAVPGVSAAAAVLDVRGEIPDSAMEGVYRGVPWRCRWLPPGSGGTVDPLSEISFLIWHAQHGDFRLGNYLGVRDERIGDPELVDMLKRDMLWRLDRLLDHNDRRQFWQSPHLDRSIA